MAFTVTARHTGTSGATAVQSQATNSTTPTANSLLLAFACVERDLHTAVESWSITGGGTWSAVTATASFPWTGTPDFNVTAVLRSLAVGASPSPHTITADAWSGVEDGYYSVIAADITGHGSLLQSKTGGATEGGGDSESLAVAFDSALTTGSLVIACCGAGNDVAGAFTAPTIGGQAMTQLHNLTGHFCHAGMWYRILTGAETDRTVTFSDLGQSVGASAAILLEYAAAQTSPAPASVNAVAGVPSPTKQAGSVVTPTAVHGAAAIPAPSVSSGTNATVTPASVSAVANVPAPAVQAGSMVAAVAVHAVSVIPSPTVTAYKYVTGISTNGRYFVDQDDNPILVRGESPWAMFTKLSLSEMDTYLGNRAGYGCNLMLVSMIGAVANGGPADTGATYDGILPFVGGDITNFNSSYWSRMDSFIAKARNLGITLMIYPMDGWNTAFASVVFNPGSVSNAQCQTYGQTLATRYASEPGIIWAFGGDYLEDSTINARFNACLTGIRAAGDTRPASIQLLYETSESHNSSFWEPKVSWNWIYTYYVTYKGVSDGYNYTWSASPTVRPALFSEGAYENSGAPHPGTDEVIRRQACWALTSGSPGELTGQEDVWDFQAGWATLLDTTAADQLKAIRDTFEPLEWWTLIPDDSNQLVTAGRGTRITTDSATFPASNNYVTAARAANGTLAVIYLPNAASAITVDMTKIGPNPTATWVDPTTGATTGATPGSSYSRGDNAAADPDWLLILTGDPGVTATPTSVTAIAGIPSPTVQAGSRPTPATVQGTAAVPSPTVRTGAVVAPVSVSGSAGIPSPTLTSSAATAPGTVSAVAAVPTAVLAAGTTATAIAVQANASVPSPAVSAGGSATIAPASVSGASVIPSASVSAGSSASVAAVSVAGAAAVPGPTVRIGVVIIPAPVAGVASVPAATLLVSVNVPVFSVAAVATIPAPYLPTIPERDLVLTASLQRNRFSAGVQPAQRTGAIEW